MRREREIEREQFPALLEHVSLARWNILPENGILLLLLNIWVSCGKSLTLPVLQFLHLEIGEDV